MIDGFHGVTIYYNGDVKNISGRNYSPDGYNLGLKYQCVEFVKRYYYERLEHKMPNSYGNAIDFYNRSISDGGFNKSRDLQQFTNPSKSKPKVSDHVAIISEVTDHSIEIVQQDPGAGSPSGNGINYSMRAEDGK